MKKIIQVVAEAVIVVISVLIASQLHLHYSVIPSFIFRYQRGFFNDKEIITIISVYVVVAAVILLVSKIIKIGNIFKSAEYFAREVFLIALGSSISALVIFVFTKVFFDPNFVALQFIIVIVLYFCGFIVLNVRSGAGQLASVFRHGLKYAFSVSGIVMILVCLSPIAMAVYFKKDKDFANVINQIRNLSEGVGLEWQLVGAYDQVPFIQPIYIRQTKAMPDRLFVLERAGRLNSLTLDGKKELLLDYSKRVGIVKVENGAVGFALHPEFGNPNSPNKGYVYVYYTDVNEERQINRLSRFDLSLPSLEERFASETVLIEQTRNMSGFHNGGTVAFGPDGFLYIGIGDASTKVNHQTISGRLFSGIFRIDVDSRGGAVSHPIKKHPDPGFTGHYMIPNDNPFVGQDGVLEEFWALGLRNPFRFSFDPETGQMWAGDVGQEQIEEVDIIKRAGNYQYSYYEGTRRTEDPIPENIIGIDSPPYFEYRHNANERAVIGGIVYRGEKHKSLNGKYVFADNAAGTLYTLELDKPGQKEKHRLAKTGQFGYVGIASVIKTLTGDILVTTLGSKEEPTGRILRLEPRDNTLYNNIVDMVTEFTGKLTKPHVHGAGYTAMKVKDTFIENCGRCHGANGRGSDEVDAEIKRVLPDFTDPAWQSSRTDDQLFEVIVKGGSAVGKNEAMPPWEGVLEDTEIRELIKFIRKFNSAAQ